MATYGPEIGENGPWWREKASCGTEIGKNGPGGQRLAGCSGGGVHPGREQGEESESVVSGGGGAVSEP